ncbi:hypothetical protein SSX86_000624 [Deinandra increscens subsp. villosa]|uniref:Protein kinase domain-containing protein n=1 Tax=Deinandra increscens subsp. villosa TaxID=3103831 RepID=A0AAP0DPS1_9ASTR
MYREIETMTPEVYVIPHVEKIDNMDHHDVYSSCIRNVSVQTGEEFSPEFIRGERKPRLEDLESFPQDTTADYAPTYNNNQNHQFVYEDVTSTVGPIQLIMEKNILDHHTIKCYTNNDDKYSFSAGKLKFMCSFGGKILPRPSDGKLRYVGGETRIISINKNHLNYQQLIHKTASIWNQPHTVKYQLPDEDLDALISVSSDEDLHHMIEEYNQLEKCSQRLRIFLASLNNPPEICLSSNYDSRSAAADQQSDYEYVLSVNGMNIRPSLSKENLQNIRPSLSKENLQGSRMDFLMSNIVQSEPPGMPRMIPCREQVNQPSTYENGQRYLAEFGCENRPHLNKQYIVWEEDMITWTESNNANFTSDLTSPLDNQYATALLDDKHSITRTQSSDLISDIISSRLQHTTTQDNVDILSSNLNEKKSCSNDLEILNYTVFAPISSSDASLVESFGDNIGVKSLSHTSEDKNGDMAEFSVLVEDVTDNLPHGIPSSTKLVPCILEEPNAEIASQSEREDVAYENRLEAEFNSGIATAEVEAGLHGLQIIKNADLEELRELGSGTFGTVYHGKWRGSDVAIKRIRKSCFAGKSSEQERLTKDFWREAQMLSNLHHPNVVALYGVVPDGPGGTLSTVTEYMTNGSLKHVLLKNKRALDWRKKLIIAQDAAIGMEYLHLKKIIHFDLKCENLLVSLGDPQRPICKVGDFGLSRIKRNTFVSGGVRGTLPSMDGSGAPKW